MSNVTEGFVLKAPRSAPSNARATSGADSGVVRAHADLPGAYGLPGDLVEVSADQYRAAVLNAPDQGTREYLLWAANSSNLAVLEDPSWALNEGTGSIPAGALTVVDSVYGTRSDGTDRVVVVDDGGRSIAGILSVTLVRGDTGAEVVATTFATADATAGFVTLDTTDLVLLSGGLSRNRGDTVKAVVYYLASQRFWWTRNDPQATRFTWDGGVQRWVPLRGGPPVEVGVLIPGTQYTLVPRPNRYPVGVYLPGNPLNPDTYTSVRVGRVPDAVYGTPVRVRVVTEEEAADPAYVFPPSTDAVVGSPGGTLVFEPTFLDAHAGQSIWYAPDEFPDELTSGAVGSLLGADLDVSPRFIVPVPDRGEYPLLRIGSRSYLTAVGVDDDAALSSLVVSSGEVGYSRTTGRLKFFVSDVAKADPDNALFDILYLGAQVFYDGVSMTSRPLRTRAPVALVGGVVGAGNDMYVPASDVLPSPGVSGVDLEPDGTGTVPNTSATPSTRPNGSGLVRSVNSVGDVLVFGRTAAMEDVEVVEFEDDLPEFPFLVRRGRCVIARELGASGSKVQIGLLDRIRFGGEQLYFLQADVQPAQYANEARVGTLRRGPFTLVGDEVLAFAVDGAAYLWSASALGAGTFTAAQVASSLAAVISGTGTAYALRDRVWLESGDPTGVGTVAIGFGSIVSGAFADRDLSGCAVLGLLPGWRVNAAGTNNWLPDAGLVFGVSRTNQNLDRTGSAADFRATYRVSNAVVSDSVGASPVVTFNRPPLEDVAGYDVGVFFTLRDGLFVRFLRPYRQVVYRFAENRMIWADRNRVTDPVLFRSESLRLGQTGVFPESMHPAVGDGFGLYLSTTGGARTLLTRGSDYYLPSDGLPGLAALISVVGGLQATGARGSFSAGGVTFTDPDATFASAGVGAGWRLKLVTGDDAVVGSYEVATVVSETTLTVRAEVPFAAAGATVSWELYTGFDRSVYDPSILADVFAAPFSPLGTETFIARVLTPVGLTPTSPSDQVLNRLRADVAEGVASGRATAVRFGESVGEPEVAAVALSNVALGTVGATLALPSVLDPHFTDSPATFGVTIGSTVYTVGGGTLLPVSTFTVGLVGDVIEYGQPGAGAIEGQLNLGADALSNHAGGTVYYTPLFRDPVVMVAGECEFDPYTGEVNLSGPDMAAQGGTEAYWVETQTTGEDVQVGPIQGTVYMRRPMRSYQVLEVSYTRATTDGSKYIDPTTGQPVDIVEQLPLFVRLEVATRVDARTYSFNPTSRTLRSDVASAVWVGPRLVTTGNVPLATVDYDKARILFREDVDIAATVRINYAVTQAFGGEQSYTVSAPPVWRAPLILPAGGTSFEAVGNRVAELPFGALLTVGPVCFYVAGATFDAVTDRTTVTVWPPSPVETGTRDPGAATPATVSNVPVALAVDGVPASGSAGFLMVVSAPYTPVDRGQTSVAILGDVTQYTKAKHLLEIGGYPTNIVGSVLSEDGSFTTVTVGTPFQRGFDSGLDLLRVSVRPIYDVGTKVFEEVGPIVAPPDASYELVRYGEVTPQGTPRPGITLVRTVDYTVDEGTGQVTLLSPGSSPFGAMGLADRVVFSFTRKAAVAPFTVNGRVVFPTYAAGYVHTSPPSEENGYLGAVLTARYTMRSPDTFYVRAVSMSDWMAEVTQKAAQDVAATNPHGGANLTIQPPQDNWSFGTTPTTTAQRELADSDRAARRFIALYDGFVRGFEQVLETIDGRVIGDRDGKFRFWVGDDATYAPPGYEDEITGSLNPRNVWSLVFEWANGNFGVSFADPLVDPYTATQNPTTLVVSGDPPDPDLGAYLYGLQRRYVLNDMDDRVVVGSDGIRMALGDPNLPLFYTSPDYRATWAPSFLSRLYPEAATAFGTTYPGIGFDRSAGNPGKYAFLKVVPPTGDQVFPRLASTFLREILPVQNPALGVIDNVQGAAVRRRLPRGRIWAYSAVGFPDLDAAAIAAGLTSPNFTGNPRPAAIVTPLPLSVFPVSQATGLPDLTQLVVAGGGLFDLTTGDVTLSTPPWQPVDVGNKVLPQVAFGVPEGSTYRMGYTGGLLDTIFGSLGLSPSYPGVFVGEVLLGCVVTFKQQDGTPIRDASQIALIGAGDPGETLPFEPEYGDTLFVVAPTGSDVGGGDNPPKVEDAEGVNTNSPLYRTGFDIGLANRKGSFRDLSLPSFKDPSPLPLKELTGQNPVTPVTCIEAEVEFTNGDTSPLQFPAMKGERTNDSGDFGIPYLNTTNTELDRLAKASASFSSIVESDSPVPNAVYPDEVVADAETYTTATTSFPPAAIVVTASDFTPVATAGSYTPHSGVGDVDEFDLVFVQTGSASLSGSQGAEGILHVGSVTSQVVEPPRFNSPTRTGDRIRYELDNAMTHVSNTGLSGVVVEEVGATTTFDISSVGGLFFNDGTVAVVSGGLNNILNPVANPFPNGNKVTIEILDRATQTLVETIILEGNTATGGSGTVVLAVAATATDKVLTVPAIGFVNFANLGTVAPGPTLEFDFKVSIDTFNAASAFVQGSFTAQVGMDRLTFREALDLRTAPERGAVYLASAIPMECRLTVRRVTASSVQSAVNSLGGTYLTFLNRDPVLNPGFVGDFSTVTGYGYVKANGFEGFGNVPLTPIVGTYRVAAMPSSAQSTAGVILNGTGAVADDSDAVTGVTVGAGGLGNVEPGDVLVIRTSATGDAAVTAGTYVVRHAVATTFGTYRQVFAQVVVGGTDGWLRTALPTVTGTTPTTVTLSSVRSVLHSPSGYDWDSSGRLTVFPNGSADLTAAVSMAYTSFIVNVDGTATFTMNAGTARDDSFSLVSDTLFFAAAATGTYASGARFVPVGQFTPSMPANNTVGELSGTVYGFLAVTTGNTIVVGTLTTFSVGTTLVDANAIPGYPATPPAAGDLGVLGTDGGTFPPASAGTFQPDPNTPVYRGVPVFLDLRGLVSTAAWSNATHGVSGVRCLAPGDVVYAHNGAGTPFTGFRALGGVFVEPSVPSRRTVGAIQAPPDLADGVPKVVDATHALPDDDVGIPNPSVHGTSPESVTFEVRRVRRWHRVLNGIGDALQPLRFAYETRRGTVATYTPSSRILVAQPDPDSGKGTQLGGFNNPDVNVNPGDVVRLLDASGAVVDQAEVSRVVDGVTLRLRAPGFQEVTPAVGQSFQVYLRQAPVPHQQSNDQLLDLITDQVVLNRVADPTALLNTGGGYVSTVNELQDAGADFAQVQVGDVIVVDPAGALAGPTGPASPVEYGNRPVGDTSVSTRFPGPYQSGAPSEFDDNRGFYRVTAKPNSSTLEVSGTTDFSGPAGSDVVYGAAGQEYAVLPTIGVLGPSGAEGQMDLRVTHYADGANSYAGTNFSVAPFSYKVIRPVRSVSAETVDLVLFIRERMLSWIEELTDGAFDASKQGSYFVFQRDEHISDVGSPTDPTDGLGVPSNVYVSSLSGLTGVAPFANTSDCLSVLDRRYWCLDTRLDVEAPAALPGEPYASFTVDNSSGGTYTVGSGRPVEPDLIDGVLDRTDRLRELRFSWVRYRADRLRGTLPAMERLSADKDTARRAAKDLANLNESEGNT